jgi:predicted metal-binding membrane protein
LAAALAWLWLLRTAMPGEAMAMPMAVAPWSAMYLASAFLMWALMMVAMMLPSAAPMILFYARFARRSGMRGAAGATAVFVSSYLAVWTLFSALAALLQAFLVAAGAASAMELALGDRRVAGLLLGLIGLYQLTPLKRSCLASCRSPLDFLIRQWRPGPAGALRLGLAHGLFCLGCCWALMGLLFVGGVMNLAWIAGIAVLVAAEKMAPARLPLRQGLGALLILAGFALLVAPAP